jgi:hypothetical protein
MIDAILKLLGPGFVAGLVAGACALFWWDHRPAATPAFHWRAPGLLAFVHFDWTAPQSLAATRDRALADDAVWERSFATMQEAFARENAAVTSLGASSALWQAQSRAASEQASSENHWRLALASQIAATPPPTDTSELGLCRAADAVLLRAAK